MNPGSEITIQIDSLAHGGAGVGRFEDFVVFVPFTAPGDTARVTITSLKKNYAEASLLEVLTPGPSRITAPCDVYGKCGGCQWQHVSYEEQLKQKQNIVQHALSRIAKEEGFELKPISASPLQFNYRNRAQVRTMGPALGFYQRGSHNLIEFSKCHLLDKSLQDEIQKIREEIEGHHQDKTSKIEIFLTENGGIARSQNQGHSEEFGFSQVNTLQNENMKKYINNLIGEPAPDGGNSLLELYCGNGNFSFPLINKGWDVYGIDGNRPAITNARERLHKMTASGDSVRAFFSCDDTTAGLRKLNERNREFSVVLTDPPRTGMDDGAIKYFAQLRAKKLVYVSCNPSTFARDWARIKAHADFKLMSVQPFDMFPQTFHVELVALAEKI